MARGSDGRFGIACGGDTFNTAVYLARAGIDVAYATALGDDPYSDGILALATAEGIATDLILRVPGRAARPLPDRDQRRRASARFNYWRDSAPARELFELPDWGRIAEAHARRAARLFLRHHAVALFQQRARPLPRGARDGAASRASRSRSTAIIARAPGRATSRARARCSWRRSSASISRCRPSTTRRCCGATQSPEATVERLQAFGIGEIVVKNGPNSALVATGGQQEYMPVPEVVVPVDTTAAGDSFNAGYMAARLSGRKSG